jgi:hypothetical protein
VSTIRPDPAPRPAPDTELTEPIPRRDGLCGATHPHLYPENACRELAGHEGQHMARDSQGRPEYVWTSGGEWDWAPDPAPHPAPDTELTERLAAAVGRDRSREGIAAALAPVVQRYADERAAEAFEAGRQSVGLGDFLPDTCGEEERAPSWHFAESYGDWLPCSRRRGHDGDHEHTDSGFTWAALRTDTDRSKP